MVMVRAKMADSVKTATTFVEQGHVRVGPEVVKDPAFIVTRYASTMHKQQVSMNNSNSFISLPEIWKTL